MDVLIKLWAQWAITLTGLLITTLEFFGLDTLLLWTTILPELRHVLGLSP